MPEIPFLLHQSHHHIPKRYGRDYFYICWFVIILFCLIRLGYFSIIRLEWRQWFDKHFLAYNFYAELNGAVSYGSALLPPTHIRFFWFFSIPSNPNPKAEFEYNYKDICATRERSLMGRMYSGSSEYNIMKERLKEIRKLSEENDKIDLNLL